MLIYFLLDFRIMTLDGGTRNISNFINTVVSTVARHFGYKTRKPTASTAPSDGYILKLHYQYTFWLLMGCFATTWYSWFQPNVISCVSHFNADINLKTEHTNICLSYPYVIDEHGQQRFIMFYRWTHYILLAVAMLYYIPHKVSKYIEDNKRKHMVEDLAMVYPQFNESEKNIVTRVCTYFAVNRKISDPFFYRHFMAVFSCLVVDVVVWMIIDFLLQSRFSLLGVLSFPYNRDCDYFTDFLSRTFPPFVKCTITKNHKLIGARTEAFGCHLLYMELYEKLFVVIWAWMVIIIITTVCYLIYLMLFWSPAFYFLRKRALSIKTPAYIENDEYSTNKLLDEILSSKQFKLGDYFFLLKLKKHLNHSRYYDVISVLCDETILEKFESNMTPKDAIPDVDDNGQARRPQQQQQQRRPQQQQQQQQQQRAPQHIVQIPQNMQFMRM